MKNKQKPVCEECNKPMTNPTGWLVGECGGCPAKHYLCPACAQSGGVKPMPSA